MKKALITLTIAALLVTISWPAGTPANETQVQPREGSRSVQFGLGIRVDANWISLNGTWSLDDVSRSSGHAQMPGARIHEVRIGAVPNVIRQAQKGFALLRALRITYLCLAKQWLNAQSDYRHPQGN
jgi:hypothetical protein